MKYKKFLPVLFSLLVTLIVFWKLPVKGLVPFPGDLLVGRFFPWNTQGWESYPLGVPFKEFISADTIRQTYPWRILAIDQIKQGQLPWWNPYSFSGTPLLANLQSAPFYPLNFLYWLFSNQSAWIIQVLLQPTLAVFFTYLLARALKLSKISSYFSSIAFAFSGYMVTWLELNTIGHTALWLPFILWTIVKAKTNYKYYLLTTIGFTSSLFAGHIQTALYILILSTAFAYYLNIKKLRPKLSAFSNRNLKLFALSFLLALGIASIQLFPAYQLLKLSPRDQADQNQFSQFLVPPKHLVTFFAPDYFGNPATNNFWGDDYNEFMGYFGLTALILAFISFTSPKKSPWEKFFLITFVVALIFSVRNPVAFLPNLLKLPILSSSSPSRALFLVQFSGAILAGFGLDRFLKKPDSAKKPLLIIAVTLLFLWALSGFNWFTAQELAIKTNWKVSLRNLVIPTGVFSGFVLAALLLIKYKNKKILLVISYLLLTVSIFESTRFANKYLPFSETRFIFPPSPQFKFISDKEDQARFFGDYTASVTSNVWLPYNLLSPEGYDSLYQKRYGQLIFASHKDNNGKLQQTIPRSDANLPANQDDPRRQRLQDLLGVKYILDKNDNPTSDWEPDLNRFPPERYQLIWQQGKFKIYQNLQALPRAFFIPNYLVDINDQKILERLFDPNWDLYHTIILEQSPQIIPGLIDEVPGTSDDPDSDLRQGKVEITSYFPNEIKLEVNTPKSQYLFLSDTHYPGWKAFINDFEVPILRANFAFRSILVPQGKHIITFKYSPDLF